MTNEEKVTYWIELSDNDLNVAEDLFSLKHYLYSGFMCHQVVEKFFKGYYVKLKEDTPPFIHDLPRIAQKGNFYELFSEHQQLFINALNPLNIEARYPEYKNKMAKILTQNYCKYIIEQTKELHQWTKEQILLKK